jgi:hypothetical protein
METELVSTIKEKANQYIHSILLASTFFERHGNPTTPTVFMSRDVFEILQAAEERLLYVNYEYHTICGYEIELVNGTEKLYVGFSLLP